MIFKKDEKKRKRRKRSILRQFPKAIVYLSDAFVFLIVFTWIFYIINAVFGGWYELINNRTTAIFTDLKDACTIPLTAGGVAWLIRTAANHLSAGLHGKRLDFDFPNIDDDGNVINRYDDADLNESIKEDTCDDTETLEDENGINERGEKDE